MKNDKGEPPLILRQHFNAVADAYCVLLQNPQNDNDYTVAWKSRHHDELVESQNFKGHRTAVRYFNGIVNSADIPLHTNISKDWQKERVYNWEDEFLTDHAQTINKGQAAQLLRKVSEDYQIDPPTFIWKKHEGGSAYMPDHKIEFGHRDGISLLHEMGHAILDKKENPLGLPQHSPAFVWTVIELYNRYAYADLQHLITTAAKADILGDLNAETKTNSLGLAVRLNV